MKFLADPALAPTGTTLRLVELQILCVCFLWSLLLSLTMFSGMDFPLSLPTPGCLYLEPSPPALLETTAAAELGGGLEADSWYSYPRF